MVLLTHLISYIEFKIFIQINVLKNFANINNLLFQMKSIEYVVYNHYYAMIE